MKCYMIMPARVHHLLNAAVKEADKVPIMLAEYYTIGMQMISGQVLLR